MQSAEQIYRTAPLGSLIRFSSGEPRPPERFTRKLKTWEHENGTGRLVERHPGFIGALIRHAPTFTLHIGDYGSGGIIVMTMRRVFSIGSGKSFEITETPKAGSVRVLTSFDGRDELQHLAPDMASAQQWMAEHRHYNMRAEMVPDPDPVTLPEPRHQAA